MIHAASRMSHMPQLDALRALAIVAVVLYHLDLPLPGGFLGVDLFFVISGFLMARSFDPQGQSSVRAREFYRRRARRLLPSLVVVAGGVALAAPWVLLSEELNFLGRSLLSVALLAPNLFFWSSFDYFSTAAQNSPLLHLWSLGVESQFYVLCPLVFALRTKVAKTIWKALILIAVAISFLVWLYAAHHHPSAGFYWLPTRLWQFGIGAICAIWALRARAAARVIGTALLLAGVSWGQAILGGVAVCVGAALIIVAPAGPVARTSAIRWLAHRSYTLYLWHWPLIVGCKLIWGPDLSLAEMVLLLGASLILADLTTRFVERPAMRIPFRLRVWSGSAVGLAGVGGLCVFASGLQGLYPPEVRALSSYDRYRDGAEFAEQTRLHRCFIIDKTPGGAGAYDTSHCLPVPDGRRRVLLVGDSHAAHLAGSLRARPGDQLLQLTIAGCRPLLRERPVGECEKLIDRNLRRVEADIVVFSARWQDGDHNALRQTLSQLSHQLLIVLGPVAEFPGGLPRWLARDVSTGQAVAADRVDPALWDMDQDLAKTVGQTRARYVSMLDLQCPSRRCETRAGDVPIQFDYGHFTAQGAARMVQRLSPVLDPHFSISPHYFKSGRVTRLLPDTRSGAGTPR